MLMYVYKSIAEWAYTKGILDKYEKAPRQKLNREKTSIFFSRNTKEVTKDFIVSVAGVNATNRYEKYLGLPNLIGRFRVSAFNGIKGRIWDKIQGWKENFLSQAHKEVLLKAIVQAIPTYIMSVFQLPKTLCDNINSMMAKFW
jgi:hypothetical protein